MSVDSGQPTECQAVPGFDLAGSISHSSLMPMAKVCGSLPSRRSNLSNSLGQMAAAPFCKDGLLGAKLHATHVHVSLPTILANAHVTGRDTAYNAGLVIKYFGGSKARINLNAERFGLLSEPATEIAERDNVVAVIVHLRRCRQAERRALGQEHELVGGDRCVEGLSLIHI